MGTTLSSLLHSPLDVLHHSVWAHCAHTMTKMKIYWSITGGRKARMKHLMVLSQKFLNLRIFGKIGIICDQHHKEIRSKLADHGFPCIFIGYSKDHAGKAYQMLNYQTKTVILSRNVIWLHNNYCEFLGIKDSTKIQVIESYDLDLDPEDSNPKLEQHLGNFENVSSVDNNDDILDPVPVKKIPREL
jgi:hypothetical protein